MTDLANAFKHFHPFTALVIGDFFFDTYITGRVKRISPEAPVPVLEVLKQESRPGGAGNVVLNLAAIGAHVFAIGRMGHDAEGQQLKCRLQADGADVSAFVIQPAYQTPVKHRFIADSQQLLRVDFETVDPLPRELEEAVLLQLPSMIQRSQIVAISDYGKGFLTRHLISQTIEMAKKAGVPVIVDPKGLDFTKYRHATVLKPNASEAYAAANMASSSSLDAVAQHLLDLSQVDKLLITRSEAGMSLFESGKARKDFPVRSREVKDVTGAGDTVLSFICLALANGLNVDEAAQLANIAACISVERLGCVQVTLAQLAQRLFEMNRDMKIFDESHSYALRHILKDKSYSLLILQHGQSVTNALLRAVKQLSSAEQQLMVYINDAHPTDEFVHLLASLNEVDMIILQGESLKNLCGIMNPYEMYCLEGEEIRQLYQAADLLSTLRSYGFKNQKISVTT
ncbi:MAG TPA: HldE protein [Parachlamydiales bacterium]|nr:HldE protein [Parachlamydiales bacterium]